VRVDVVSAQEMGGKGAKGIARVRAFENAAKDCICKGLIARCISYGEWIYAFEMPTLLQFELSL